MAYFVILDGNMVNVTAGCRGAWITRDVKEWIQAIEFLKQHVEMQQLQLQWQSRLRVGIQSLSYSV